MALINIDTTLNKTKTTLLKLPFGAGLEILSYKRNRGVSILRLSEGEFQVIERGFLEQELRLAPDDLAKALKAIIRREFPRSRKVRVYNPAGRGRGFLPAAQKILISLPMDSRLH